MLQIALPKGNAHVDLGLSLPAALHFHGFPGAMSSWLREPYDYVASRCTFWPESSLHRECQFNNMGISLGMESVWVVSCLPDSNRIQSLAELDLLVIST